MFVGMIVMFVLIVISDSIVCMLCVFCIICGMKLVVVYSCIICVWKFCFLCVGYSMNGFVVSVDKVREVLLVCGWFCGNVIVSWFVLNVCSCMLLVLCIGGISILIFSCCLCSSVIWCVDVVLISFSCICGWLIWNVWIICGRCLYSVLFIYFICIVLVCLVVVLWVVINVWLVCCRVVCVFFSSILLVVVSFSVWLLCWMSLLLIVFFSCWMVVVNGGCDMCRCVVVWWKCSFLVMVMN